MSAANTIRRETNIQTLIKKQAKKQTKQTKTNSVFASEVGKIVNFV